VDHHKSTEPPFVHSSGCSRLLLPPFPLKYHQHLVRQTPVAFLASHSSHLPNNNQLRTRCLEVLVKRSSLPNNSRVHRLALVRSFLLSPRVFLLFNIVRMTGFGNNTAGSMAFGAKPATTGFGAFGGTTQQPSTFGNAFGAAAPAGQPAAPGAFGQPSTSTGGGFGTTNAFAPKPANTTFGAPAGMIF
jgi:hypothetical protein